MSNRKLAAILAVIGIVSYLATMAVHANPGAVDALFYGATACLALAAIIFLADVAAKAWGEASHSG